MAAGEVEVTRRLHSSFLSSETRTRRFLTMLSSIKDFPKMKSATTAQETLKQIYSNRNLSSVYSIPRKQAGPGCCLEEVKVHGREWREVVKIVQQSVMDRRTMARWRIDRVQLCTNTTLEERFIRRRQKMKEDGRSAKELTEHYAFYVVSHGKARHVCQSGLWASFGQTAFANILGRSDMGVYVRRNADIALKLAEKCNFTVTALMVFKIIPGRIKSIPTSFTPIEDAIEPTPNFDSHVSNRLPTAVQKEAHQLANSCIYLYEYDESCRPSKAPSQILPYAVVSCTQISKPKVLLASPVVSLTDVSSSDTDGRGSDMDIVDDSADEKESSATSVSIEAVKGKQASERTKKLSVEDIQGCNLGAGSRSETGVFLKPAPLPRENKISPTKNHGANSATSQATSGTTLLKPATFQYGKKELQTNDKRTVSSSNSSSTSSQRYQDMAAGFFAKLKDPRIRSGQRSNELHASSSSMRGSSKCEIESRPEIPQKVKEARLDAKTKVRQAEHSAVQLIEKASLHVLGRKTASRQEMQVGHCSKPVLPKCNMSSKSRAVDSSASKFMGSIKKRKPSAKLKEKIRIFLADETQVSHEIKKTTAGIQKEKKPGEKVKETKTHRIQKDARDGTSSAFERQLEKSRHANDSKQHASVSNPAKQHNKEEVKKQSDTTVREPVGGKGNDSNPSDSEHTEMLSVLQSLDQTLDLLTPTVTLSSSEMSDSASEATVLCRACKIPKTELLKTEENHSAIGRGQEEESMCLEIMEIPEQTISEATRIGCDRDNMSTGNMSLEESSSVGSVQLNVAIKEEDRIQETDTNMEKESKIWLQALGIEKLPEDAFPTKTVKQEAADASDPTCPNSGGEVYSSQEKMMEPKKTSEEEENGGTNASMLVIDQVFSLAYTEKAQEESAIPGDTAISFPYHLAKQGTITDTSLPPSQIMGPQALDQNGLPDSDARNLDREADHLGTNATRNFISTTSEGVAHPQRQTRRTSMCEDTGRATLEQRGGTADVRGEQDCQPSCESECYALRCTWQTKEDTVLESLLTGALNTLELGVQKLQSNSDCPQLVVAVRTAATIATRTSTTLLELAVQEVRDHISRKAGQTVEEMFQPPPLDCRKLESLISGTINTLKMMSDDIDGTCSLQTSFRTALTLLELALDILWMRNHSGANTVGQPQLCPQADNMASEARHPMEHQSNVFTGQWEESGAQSQTSQWHNNNMVTVDQEKFSMEKEEECGSRHRQLITAGTNDASKSAKPVTPPPLPPPPPNFLFFPPQQLFTATRRQVNSLSVPSPDELGADHNGNLVGMLAKCGDSREPEGAMNRNKQTTKSLQTEAICREMQTTTKVEGTHDDEEITPNLSVKPQKIMVDYDMKSHAQVDPLAGAEKSHMWTDEGAKKIARFEDPTATACDQPMPIVTSGTEQDGGLTGKEGMSTLQTKATFPSKDSRAMSGFSVLKENDCMQPHSCDPEKLTIKEETDSSLDHQQVCVKTCADNSSTSPEQRCKTEESYADPCNTEEEKHVHGTQKSEERKEKVEEESHDHENHEEKRPGKDVPSQPCASQASTLSHLAGDDMLADDVLLHPDDADDDHEFFSISNDSSSLSSSILSVGGQSSTSLSSHDSLLWSKEAVVENTSSEVASRPFSCFASPLKEEPTDEDNCSLSAKLAATANIDPALGNKLALAAELPTKLSCPKMLINESGTTSPVREKTTQKDGRQKEKDAYERARRQWKRLFKSFVDHQKANNKASGEVKVEEHLQKSPHIDSCSAPLHGSKVETKTELKEQNTSGCPGTTGSHKACNSPVLCEATGGSSPTNCCKDSDSPLCLCKSELYKTSSMKRPQDKALGDEGLILQKQEKSASPKSSDVVPLYNAIHMSQDSKLYDAPFDFDMVLSCARSCHAQEMLQCVADRMKKVSAEMEHFQQGIMQLELDKSSFDGLYLQKDQHMLLLRSAIIHLSEISTEFEMLQATETYLSNIRRKEMGHKEKKTPLRDVNSIMPEEDFAPPEERKPDTIRNILLRQLDMKKGQVKALHKSLKSYQSINGNNFEFVRMLLRSQIHTCGTDIQRLEEKLREENPSVKIDCNEAKISLVQERQTKCQELLKVLVKDSSQDYAKIEWCKMKSRRYHGILLYEGDKCYLRERRTRSKSSPSAADDKTKGLVSRESSRAKTKNSSSSKTIKRQHDAEGKQPHRKNDPSRKRRKTCEPIQQRLGDEDMSTKGYMNPTADDAATVESRAGCLSATSQEKSIKREKSSCLQNCRDRPEQKRPKLLVPTGNGHETQQQSPTASRLPSPCDLHQKLLRDRESLISSKSLPVVVTPAASGQAEDASCHPSQASQDIFGKLTGTTKSALSAKCPLDSKCAMKAKTADASGHSSKASQNVIGKPTGSTKSAKGPLDSEGAVKAKTTAVTKPIQTCLTNRTFHSPSRKASVSGIHTVPYTYPAQNTPPHHVQYPTSHLRPRMNWWSQGPNVLHRPMFPPQPLFPFPNQQMFPNRWPTK
uniref:TASOR pseudo-PARP domain-containing protein n=1 Tax=Branchiostoma floridae TaxID=7739 RepID=C3ZWG9_BRAFL|eukprot:XP_002587087.1 hypothetical protein BRAFLDRAFT_130098 [Branchiostoma floridae]